MSVQYDDPNREAVGLEPAWVEGSGGTTRAADPKTKDTAKDDAPKAKDDAPKAKRTG